jgi:hypothetical protein
MCSNLNNLNTFSKETSSNKVKLPKVGSNAIVPVPVKARPNKPPLLQTCLNFVMVSLAWNVVN